METFEEQIDANNKSNEFQASSLATVNVDSINFEKIKTLYSAKSNRNKQLRKVLINSRKTEEFISIDDSIENIPQISNFMNSKVLTKAEKQELKKKEKQEEALRKRKEASKESKKKEEKKKSKNVNPKISEFVERSVTLNSTIEKENWAVSVCHSNLSDSEIYDLILQYVRDENQELFAILQTVKTGLFEELQKAKNKFDLKKLDEISIKSNYLKVIVDEILNKWTTRGMLELSNIDFNIMMKIIQIMVNDNIKSIPISEILTNQKLISEINDRNLFSFNKERLIRIITETNFSTIFRIQVFQEIEILSINERNAIIMKELSKYALDFSGIKDQYKKILPYENEKVHNAIAKIITKYSSIRNISRNEYDELKSFPVFLGCHDVVEQMKEKLVNLIHPTELQQHLFDILTSNKPVANVLIGPPGCGKTTCLMTKDTNSLLVCVPINIKSFEEMVLNFCCSHIPFVLVQPNEDGSQKWEASYETMGKIPYYDRNGVVYEKKYSNTLQDLYSRLEDLEYKSNNPYIVALNRATISVPGTDEKSRKEREKMLKKLAKTSFFTKKIQVIICHPHFRLKGADDIYIQAQTFARTSSYLKNTSLSVTVFVDDFGANCEEMLEEFGVKKLCLTAERIILASGTAPTNLADPQHDVNTLRSSEGLVSFTTNTFTKTLGSGLELSYIEKPFSILLEDHSTFMKLPQLFENITMDMLFDIIYEFDKEDVIDPILIENTIGIDIENIKHKIENWLNNFDTNYEDSTRKSEIFDHLINDDNTGLISSLIENGKFSDILNFQKDEHVEIVFSLLFEMIKEKDIRPFISKGIDIDNTRRHIINHLYSLDSVLRINIVSRLMEKAIENAHEIGKINSIEKEMPYSLLLENKVVFDNMPSAFQTISVNMTFELLIAKLGERGARNFILTNKDINLDDIRENVMQWLYQFENSETRIQIVIEIMRKIGVARTSDATQKLFINSQPLQYARLKLGDVTENIQGSDGKVRSFFDTIRTRLDDYDKEKKRQEKQEESDAKSSVNESGETKATKGRDKNEVIFNRTNINPRIPLRDVIEQINNYSHVGETKLCYLLQKDAVIIDDTTPGSWADQQMKERSFIFGTSIKMGVGVDIPTLDTVYIDPETTEVAKIIQNIGRVGRPSQHFPGKVVFPNIVSLTRSYNTDFGAELSVIFRNLIRRPDSC